MIEARDFWKIAKMLSIMASQVDLEGVGKHDVFDFVATEFAGLSHELLPSGLW